jgi:uncharacterized protein (TIGR02996 family)
MNLEAALRQAVVDNPADDAPRRAYAAWCETHAMPARAAFIRAQLERDRVPADSPAAERWFQEEMRARRARPPGENWWMRHEHLVADYQARTGRQRTSLSFRDQRGFIGGMGGKVADVVEVADAIAAIEPIESLWLQWTPEQDPRALDRLATLPMLTRITALSLNAATPLLQTLGKIDPLPSLASLHLWDAGNPAPIEPLAAALHTPLANVRRLMLQRIALPPEEMQRLCLQVLARGRWTHLALDAAALGDTGARRLAAAAGLENLETLSLADNRLTAAGLEALVNAPALPAVRDLNIADNPLDAPGIAAVHHRTGMHRLQRLGIKNSVREEIIEDWMEWTGASLGSGPALRVVEPAAVSQRHPIPGITFY